jgi:hypothetical protein
VATGAALWAWCTCAENRAADVRFFACGHVCVVEKVRRAPFHTETAGEYSVACVVTEPAWTVRCSSWNNLTRVRRI